MTNKQDKTQVEITKETRIKLQQIKICNRESYNEIINRLLNKFGGTENGKNV